MPQSPDNDIFATIPKKAPEPEIQPVVKSAPPTGSKKPLGKKDPRSSKTKPAQDKKEKREQWLRRLWTITSVISMIVNLVVVLVLIALFMAYAKVDKPLALPEGISVDTPKDLLKGLYDNFQLMDAAHIKTDIVVEDTIPVQFDLPLNQATTVKLSQNVTIYGAYVVINTATININAPATVTLPAGTDLPIILDLVVPVDTTIPVKLNVPVDIALEGTDLHKPFVGLQDVVRPLYCLVDPDALSLPEFGSTKVCP